MTKATWCSGTPSWYLGHIQTERTSVLPSMSLDIPPASHFGATTDASWGRQSRDLQGTAQELQALHHQRHKAQGHHLLTLHCPPQASSSPPSTTTSAEPPGAQILLHKPYRVMCSPGFQQPGNQQPPLLPRQTPGHIPTLESPEGKQAHGSHRIPPVLPFLKASKFTTSPFLHLKLLNSAKELRYQP